MLPPLRGIMVLFEKQVHLQKEVGAVWLSVCCILDIPQHHLLAAFVNAISPRNRSNKAPSQFMLIHRRIIQ